jgi:hypothetical protein
MLGVDDSESDASGELNVSESDAPNQASLSRSVKGKGVKFKHR